jgi:hypothetical protein
VPNGFYVDVYINPSSLPSSAAQPWDQLASEGMVWAIADDSLEALTPGGTIALGYQDNLYQEEYSRFSGILASGTLVYAQVDTYPGDDDGLVLETHEQTGGMYNNIYGPVLSPELETCHLPVAARHWIEYAPRCGESNAYCESHNTPETAYGDLEPNADYQAYPDDRDDYYYFVLNRAQETTITLREYRAEGDLVLYRHRAKSEPEMITHWSESGPDMQLGPRDLRAGRYYVRVYTASDHTDTEPYTLTVAY